MKDFLSKIFCVYFVFHLSIDSASCLALKKSLKFFFLGDMGGIPVQPYSTITQVAVSIQMSEIAEKEPFDFVVALGDNFYFDGVKDVDDERFRDTYERVYQNKSLQIPWLILAGNHDHYGNASAQIAYSKKSKRWIFPDFFYVKSFNIPSSTSKLDIIMIDTVILCGNTNPYDPYIQPVLLKSGKRTAENYWNWIENKLQTSKANYLLVCGHYPVYSIASHGNTECLVDRLLPMLEKYHVSAYISGHDHDMQHIQVKNNDWMVEYFVIGAANFVDDSKKHQNHVPKNSLKFHWGHVVSLGAFARADITKNKLNITFIEGNGKHLYSYSIPPRLNISHREML